jgi:hypothetical protein
MAGRSEYVEVELPSGEVLLAEVSAIGPADVSARERFRLDEARVVIGEVARWAVDSVLAGLPDPPDKVGVEFGVKLAVKSGKLMSVLAEAGGEASLTVKLEWTRPASGDAQ